MRKYLEATTHPTSIYREPNPILSPFIKFLWASKEKNSSGTTRASRERMLPSGGMHFVFRLSDEPIRIFESVQDYRGCAFHRGVVGGLRAGFYVKDIASSSRTVGAILRPGAAEILFGVKADELAERHTLLEDLWGPPANVLWEQLQEQTALDRQLDLVEAFLLQRLPQAQAIHPAIAFALRRFQTTADVGDVVDQTGYSHRRFIELFKRSVGLPPRVYTRILRFQRVFKLISNKPQASWIDVAMAAGYFDQAHFNREFREFTGMSPSQYMLSRTGSSLHVPILSESAEGQFYTIHSEKQSAKSVTRGAN